MKAGSMGKGAVWAFAFGAIVLGFIVSFVQQKLQLGAAVGFGGMLGVWGAMGYLGVYLTKATKGQGIVAFLVSSIALSVIMYVVIATVFSHATSELTTTTVQVNGLSQADTQRAAAAAGGLMVGFFGAVVAIVGFLIAFISSMVGCLIGGSAKNKAGAAIPARV